MLFRSLPAPQRELLLTHVVDEQRLATLSVREAGAPAVAAQLARIRARLRLDYLLALRQVTLVSARCRPVLLALAAGDRRRQTALRAGEHLLHCPVCAGLSEPLVKRQSALAGFVPLVSLGTLHGKGARFVRRHPGSSLGAVAASSGAVVVALVLASQSSAPPASTAADPRDAARPSRPAPASAATAAATAGTARSGTLVGRDGPVLASAADLRPLVGQAVDGRRVRVLDVPTDEGFWVGRSESARVWVQLRGRGESGVRIRPGQLLSFTATVVANPRGFVGARGLSAGAGAAQLTEQGAHLELRAADVTVEAP